jgi:hypothetical protein
MLKLYQYTVEGSGGNAQTWKTTGKVTAEFHDVFLAAVSHSFDQLTKGKAVFGKPGVGCQGPYDVHKVLIEQVKQ